jgi:hypothetical protein
MTKLSILLGVTSSIFFMACTSADVPMTPKSPAFKMGEKDGCMTATGEYTKDSTSFHQNKDYQNGWFEGRKNCNPVHDAK